MYLPPAFEEKSVETLWSFVAAQPLGLLVSRAGGELCANLMPFEAQHNNGKSKLLAHMARANAQWRDISGQKVLVAFQGAHAFITPRWYASKKLHGKVVPTWNYAMVQVRGVARIVEDVDWLLKQVSRLTDHHERTVPGQAWQVSDAPEHFIQSQLKGIVGLEIEVDEVAGKVKASQNRPAEDRSGVVGGLEGQNTDHAKTMAAWVARSGLKG